MENEISENLQNQSESIQLVNHDSPTEPLKTKKSPINIILLSALLITFGVTVFFGYKYYQLSKVAKTPEQELIVESTPPQSLNLSPALETTLNWEKYINKNYKYEIKYPKGWEIADLASGEQVEIYYQSDKTKAVGSILIESISSSLYNNSLRSISSPIEKTIGRVKAKCHTDELSKTWCYFSNNGKYFSILIVKNGNKTYDDNLDLIVSTLEFVENDFSDSVETELESSKPNGWISHEFPAIGLIIYTPTQWKSSSENFADTSSTLLRFWEAGNQENATIQFNITPNWDNIGIGSNYTYFTVADNIQAYRVDPPKMEEKTLDRYQTNFYFERKGQVYSLFCAHNWMETNIETCEKMLQTMEFVD